jgi:acylphosphatase
MISPIAEVVFFPMTDSISRGMFLTYFSESEYFGKSKMNASQASTQKTLHLVIHGRVQGVFFRQSMLREALNMSITGWVRNRSDGKVEAIVQGESNAVDAIVRWAQRGPERASVERVEMLSTEGSYSNFEIMN